MARFTDEQIDQLSDYLDERINNVMADFEKYIGQQLGIDDKDVIEEIKNLLSPFTDEKTQIRSYNWLSGEGWIN